MLESLNQFINIRFECISCVVICAICNFNFSVKRKISFKKMLNNRGPRMDPCGTPCLISPHELYEEFTFVLRLRFDK